MADDQNTRDPDVAEAPAPVPQPQTPDEIDRARGYRVTKWHHHDNFECLSCQYATLWIGKMQKHQEAGIHIWAHPSEDTGELSHDDEPDNDGPDY